MKCSICKEDIKKYTDFTTGKIYWENGNNAQPITDGRCCDNCDTTIVIPERIKRVLMGRKNEK